MMYVIMALFFASPIIYSVQKALNGDMARLLAILTVVGVYFYADHQYRKDVKEAIIKDGGHYDEERDNRGLLEDFFRL